MNSKVCSKCKEAKDVSFFRKHKGSPEGLYAQCKPCAYIANKLYRSTHRELRRLQQRKWADANQERYFHRRRINHLNGRFGLSVEAYKVMLDAQDGTCAICLGLETVVNFRTDKILPLAVDHNHSTGKIRGLLCIRCNFKLGSYENNPEYCKDMKFDFDKYLDKFN